MYTREKLLVDLVEITKFVYAFFFKKHKQAWGLTRNYLLLLPPNTFGHHLGSLLVKNNIELIPKLESHDIEHLLFEYPLEPIQEVYLQICLFALGKKSLYLRLSLIFSVVILPEKTVSFIQHYAIVKQKYKNFIQNKSMRTFQQCDWRHYLEHDLALLKQNILLENNFN